MLFLRRLWATGNGCWRLSLPIFVLLVLSTAICQAQKAPEVGYVFPPVLRAGATQSVQFGGYDWPSDSQLRLFDDSLTVRSLGDLGPFIIPPPPYWFGPKGRSTAFPIPREFPAEIDVPVSAPSGLTHWQISNANGLSATAVFAISHEPEMVEERDRDFPIQIPSLPMGVSGRLQRIAECDRYEFTPSDNGVMTVTWRAREFGANFNGCLQVLDSAGETIADAADTDGTDGSVTISVRGGERYQAIFFDAEYRGNQAYVYHLQFSHGPAIVLRIPVASDEIDSSGDQQCFVTRLERGPDGDNQWSSRIEPHAADKVEQLLPIAFLEAKLVVGSSEADEIDLGKTMFWTQTLSQESQVVATWKAKAEQEYRVALLCQSLLRVSMERAMDLELVVVDENGKEVFRQDDGSYSVDPEGTFRVATDGVYQMRAKVLSGQWGKLHSICVATIKCLEPGFSLEVPQITTIPVGGKSVISVKVNRFGGFAESISLTVSGLPVGVTLAMPVDVPAKAKTAKLELVGEKGHAVQVTNGTITGSAEKDGVTWEVNATAELVGDLVRKVRTEHLSFATTLAAPVKVQLIDKNRQRAVHRGTTYAAEFVVKRDEGYSGEVLLQMAARQGRHRQGITAPTVHVPGDKSSVFFPCVMPEWLETDRTTRMAVMGVALVEDVDGTIRGILTPADARITMILEGALLKVAHDATVETSVPGKVWKLPFQIARASKLAGPVAVDLVIPEPLAGFVACNTVEVPAGEELGQLNILTRTGGPMWGQWTLQLKATARQPDGWPVESVVDVQVNFGPGPSGE